jgi:glucokinase
MGAGAERGAQQGDQRNGAAPPGNPDQSSALGQAAPAPGSPLAGAGHVGAVDLGGTKILAAVFDAEGQIVSRAKLPTGRDHTPAVVLDRIADCLREAARRAGVAPESLAAVGLGAPGPIDLASGTILLAPNLDWVDVPLRAELEARLGVAVEVGNDVRVAVLAEHGVGAARGARDVVAIWPGTGVGGGLILDDRLYTGSQAFAGEIGHITVKAGGPRCGCGGRGHLESLCSRTAIVKRVARAVRAGEKSVLTRKTGKDVTRAASGDLAWAHARGDKVVGKAVDEAARYLALGIASMANLLNPELVVLGGGVVEGLGERFVEQVRAYVAGMPLTSSTGSLRIVKSTLGDDAGITGGALLARRTQVARRETGVSTA